MGNSDTWIVVSAFNEQEAVRPVIDSLLAEGYHVALVDDCSTDGTADRIRDLPVHILTHTVNLGAGAAYQTGITYALSQGAGYIVSFDADGQHRAEDIPALLAPLKSGAAEIALGTRFSLGGEALNIPPGRRALLWCATVFTKLTTGLTLTDTHCGLRALTASAAGQVYITLNRMAHASQLLSQIAEKKIAYIEVPVHVVYTEYSLGKGQRMSNAFNILWESVMEFFRI